MRYAVTYLINGERQADHVAAPNEASAVAVVHETRGRAARSFELLSVLRVNDQPTPETLSEVQQVPPA
jgi:hypothetical protein